MKLLESIKVYIAWLHVGTLLFCEDTMLSFRGLVFLSLHSGAHQQVRYMNFYFDSNPQQRAGVFCVQGDKTRTPYQ